MISNDWKAIAYAQVVPGPGRATFTQTLTRAGKNAGAPTPAGGYAQIAAFLFVTYSPQTAVIELVTRSDSGTMQLETTTVDYAGAVSTQRGRCHRLVYDADGKPAHCPEPIIATGWTRLDRWYEVDACAEHAGQLRKPSPYPGR